MEQALFIVGVNHRTAPVAVRERLAYAEDEVVSALRRLKQKVPSLAEAALLSTCNRVEFVAVAADPEAAADQSLRFVAADREVEGAAFTSAVYRLGGREA